MIEGLIELMTKKEKRSPFYQLPEGHVEIPVRFALPLYKPNSGLFTHRVRSGKTHVRHGITSHTSLDMWCGSIGFLNPDRRKEKGVIFKSLKEDSILCLTCERKAIANGWPAMTSDFDIQFSPERKS